MNSLAHKYYCSLEKQNLNNILALKSTMWRLLAISKLN